MWGVADPDIVYVFGGKTEDGYGGDLWRLLPSDLRKQRDGVHGKAVGAGYHPDGGDSGWEKSQGWNRCGTAFH